MADFNEGEFEGISDYRDLAGVLTALHSLTIRAYLEAGHADPIMYQAVKKLAELSQLIGNPEFTDELEILKLEVGNKVDEVIEERNIPISREEWS